MQGLKLPIERIGLEACSLTAWLHEGLCAAGLPAIRIETRQANAAMRTIPPCATPTCFAGRGPWPTPPNETDRNDARALAQIMRAGWFGQVHVKRRQCRLWRWLLVVRRTVLNEMRTTVNVVGAMLREAGLKVGTPSRAAFDGRVRELCSADATALAMVEPLPTVLLTMLRELARLTKQVLAIVRDEKVCRRLMSAPGVGPITALAFRATIDRPDRFGHSRDVGPSAVHPFPLRGRGPLSGFAHLGLTPSRHQSGETDIQGRISRRGDEMARTALYEAANTPLVRGRKWSGPRAWGMKVAKHRGMARARVAVARKLAVILRRMWSDDTDVRFGSEPAPMAA